ncbi:MAG TPA: hypothetical protein RMH85_18115 [Polyangiaceae bacterium LLY-WYZ-15_(1-7)]|nr:hypothetical protein [Sandaracinus sp.]HJK93380.1 hypothetical protein [Polyangiaceae bacterium LLY-WYZ-15_(1-7)]MBJ74095.1 hypothetical protein [Sandaracinus sp.]HJL04183.1 hypothetical protein [Polyangiaceae bacterium LLY-WYZ-15_(1-7)]HJL10421.1 hypothetical protein [Polyangiaceae bacterium LLY-WYZ-15_(1-7)]
MDLFRCAFAFALALALVLGAGSQASADAIMTFEGACPPGTEKGIAHHAEACIPRTCTSDSDCGSGASCQELCVCRAPREFRGEGRIVYDEPVTRVVEVGFCDAAGACPEGERGTRRQCEPDEDTPAWNRAGHSWSGQPHPDSGLCAAGGAREAGGTALALLGAGGLLAWRRRRRT